MAADPLIVYNTVFDASGKYRYSLGRMWQPDLLQTCWILFNPSIADSEKDDPTVRRCMGFARRWGHGGIVIVNLFARVSRFPIDLASIADPIGPRNDAAILEAIAGRVVICGWGDLGGLSWMPTQFRGRARAIAELLEQTRTPAKCLGVTKAGNPSRPLYLRQTKRPRGWRIPT